MPYRYLSVGAATLALTIVALPRTAAAATRLLHSQGPLITSPTGGTGPIAGQPLSKADTFTLPSGSVVTPATGYNATKTLNVALADDFFVPDGGWDLDQITVFAYQTSPTNATTFGQTITKAYLNLWDATPVSLDTPGLPAGTTIPQPLLSEPLSFDVTGQGQFIAHRTSGSSTKQPAAIYAYTLDVDALPANGKLAAGQYWLEMSFEGVGAFSNNVFVPQVTPRSAVTTNFNARQYAVPLANSPLAWFEAREFYQSAAQPGRPLALPFELVGTPEPATLLTLATALPMLAARRRR